MATMRDVAAIAEVSAKTVSRVFNGDPHVLPETRERVEAALRQLNYVPNGLATAFRTGRAPVIGIAVPDVVDPFFAAISKSVTGLAATHDMATVITNIGDDAAREKGIVESLLRQSVSGLIIAPVTEDHGYLAAWAERVPIVFVDREPRRLRADSFTEDDFDGAREATLHLVSHGHREIAFVGDTVAVPTTRNRLAGYRAALAARGLADREEHVVFGVGTRSGAAEALDALDASAARPTAVFSSNARCTMALISALGGRDLAVVGFGDFPMADTLAPAVTVIDQDPATLGALAAERVFARLAHPNRRYRRRTLLPVRLVERGSCRTAVPLAEVGRAR